MIPISIALAFVALCAWDAARRWIGMRINARVQADMQIMSARIDQVVEELAKTDRVQASLATEWRDSLVKLEDNVRRIDTTLQGKASSWARTTINR